MRRAVRWVHVYAGLALSLLLFALAVSGGALVYKEAWWRAVYPELRGPAPRPGPEGHAAALAAAEREFGPALRSVKLPEPGVPAYHLYLADGEAFLSAGDHRVIDRWRPRERVMPWLFDLHAHLMAGEAGERVGGAVGLAGFVLGLTGLVLWWPARRRFSAANVVPRALSRRALLAWHRDLGAATSPIVLLLLLTGGGIVFYGAAQTVLNGLFGDPVPAAAAPAAAGAPLAPADARGVAAAQAAFPDARLVFYYPAREGIHRFRLKRPCELHPNGRSYVSVDGRGRVVERADACALPPGERGVHALYPLHAGKADSALYKILVFLGAVALAGLSASGAVTYLQKIRRLPG